MKKKTLYLLCLLYLSLSTALFDIYWLKADFVAPSLFFFIIASYFSIKQILSDNSLNEYLSSRHLVYILGFTVFLITLLGVGGFSYQNIDYFFHNSKFYDLITSPLPVYYKSANQYACYYFGYYLPVSLITKHLDIQLLPYLIYLWTALGVFLAIVWLYIISNKNITTTFLFFLCGGTLSFIVVAAQDYHELLRSGNKPFSEAFLSYLSFTLQTYWVVNQIPPVLIGTCIIIHDVFYQKRLYRPYFLILSTLYWSPFASAAMFLLFAFLILRNWYYNPSLIRDIIKEIPYLLISTIAFIPLILLLVANNAGEVMGFIGNFVPNWFTVWLFFIITEVLILWVFIPKNSSFLKPILTFSLIILILIPLFRIGKANDFCMRFSMPFLLVLYLCFVKGIFELKSKFLRVLAFCIFLISMSIPIKLLGRGLITLSWSNHKNIKYDKFEDTYAALLVFSGTVNAKQYLFKEDTIFYKYLLDKKPQAKTSQNQNKNLPTPRWAILLQIISK